MPFLGKMLRKCFFTQGWQGMAQKRRDPPKVKQGEPVNPLKMLRETKVSQASTYPKSHAGMGDVFQKFQRTLWQFCGRSVHSLAIAYCFLDFGSGFVNLLILPIFLSLIAFLNLVLLSRRNTSIHLKILLKD